jgi:hypothetical protein
MIGFSALIPLASTGRAFADKRDIFNPLLARRLSVGHRETCTAGVTSKHATLSQIVGFEAHKLHPAPAKRAQQAPPDIVLHWPRSTQ